MGKYISFDYVNEHGSFLAVLDHYGLEYTRKGDQIRMLCPFHEDTEPSLSITLVKTGKAKANTYYCFGCHAKGSLIDFGANMENDTSSAGLRAAAEVIAGVSGCALAESKGSSRRRSRKKDEEGPISAGAARTAPEGVSGGVAPEKGEEGCCGGAAVASGVNPPLRFELNAVPDHPYLAERVPPATAEYFGLGFVPADSRSMFKNRVVIPLHDFDGNLIGYLGRHAAETVPDGVEKYLLPPKLDKLHVLFNISNLDPTDDIVIVESAFSAMRLHMLGAPVVALLGTTVSVPHVELLRKLGVRRVLLLFDGDDPGQAAIPAALDVLARSFFVTVGELPAGLDPDEVDEDVLHGYASVFTGND